MKRIYIFAGLTVLVSLILFMQCDSRTESRSLGDLLHKETEDRAQALLNECDFVDIKSASVTNRIAEEIGERAGFLSRQQSLMLGQRINQWLLWLDSGDFEDFQSFRDWDIIDFEFDVEESELEWLGLEEPGTYNWREMMVSDNEISGDESDIEVVGIMHDRQHTIVFDSVCIDSIRLIVSESNSQLSNVIDPFSYHPGVHQMHYHHLSKLKYNANPRDVIDSEGRIVWASIGVALKSPTTTTYAVPVQLALFWSPMDERWLASELCLGAIPAEFKAPGIKNFLLFF